MGGRLWAALLLCLPVFVAPAFAGAETKPVLAPIHRFIDSMNKGDANAAAATFAPDANIIDEFAPYHWQGDDAFAKWGADFAAMSKAGGVSDMHLTLGRPRHVNVSGDHAYVVVPTLITFKQRGKAVREHGTFTFALSGAAGVWRLAAWAWTTK